MKKFRKLKDFNVKNLDQDENLSFVETFCLIDVMLPNIFPNEAGIKKIIKNHKRKKGSYRHDEYILDCLPHNLRNDKWLVQYLTRYLAEKNLLDKINPICLNEYVKLPNFKKACKEFGDLFIKTKLEHMMVARRAEHETVVDAGFPDFNHRIDCDEYFRQHALTYFILKGFDRHTIEANLEKNANIWRKQTMCQAFENICNLEILVHDFPKSNIEKMQFYHKKYEYRKLWLKFREYEYYQRHKGLIDKLGLATDDMKLSPKEASDLLYAMEAAGRNMTRALNKNLDDSEDEIKM